MVRVRQGTAHGLRKGTVGLNVVMCVRVRDDMVRGLAFADAGVGSRIET